jgi:glycosyltransferase involved in cell wall biosynthesis
MFDMQLPELANFPPPPPGKAGFPWTRASEFKPVPISNEHGLPRISIVTPSFNQAPFIEETMRSVLLQGYPNTEYIVIDGGSTDGTVDIIRKYERWLTYWVSEPDQGQSDAINKGWQRCTGELLTWMNSDDYYMPNVFSQVAGTYVANGAPDMIYGEIGVTDGTRLTELGYQVSRNKMLSALNFPQQSASFFKRSVVEAAGYLDSSLHYVMDFALILKILANTDRLVYVPATLGVFRFHPASKTTTSAVKFADELIRVWEHVLVHWDEYPGLHALGKARVRSAFYRLASKQLYLGNCFRDSFEYMILACRVHPASTLSIVSDVGVRWLVRRLLPTDKYRQLSNRLGAKAMPNRESKI